MIPFLNQLGCILYNDKQYISHLHAMEDCVGFEPKLQMWFNDDVFSSIATELEPPMSLPTLYKMRAKQLREKYDYLILSYSGGSDSHQVLKTFEKNDILLDEVHANYPLKLLEKTPAVRDPDHPLGLIFEYELTAMPALRSFAKKSPKTKIQINDYTDFLEKNYRPEFFQDNEKHLAFTAAAHYDVKRVFQKELFQKISDRPLKTAIILGAEKPQLRIYDRKLAFYFIPMTMSSIIQKGDSIFTPEPFYWSRDCPLIPVKQGHLIRRHLKSNLPLLKHFIKRCFDDDAFTFLAKFTESNLVKSLIYDDWDVNTYQKRVKNHDEGIISHFLDLPALDILREKNDHFFKKYSRITKSSTNIAEYNTELWKPNIPLASARSRFYPIGAL